MACPLATPPLNLQLGPPQPFTMDFLREEIEAAQGIALIVDTGDQRERAKRTARKYGGSRGVAVMAYRTDDLVKRAIKAGEDGVLILVGLDRFDDRAVDDLAAHLKRGRDDGDLVPEVVAISMNPPDDVVRFTRLSETIGDLPLFYLDTGGEAHEVLTLPPAAGSLSTVRADLAVINAHRRSLGMRPLDPVAAGWTDEDVRIEAEALRARGNPRLSCLGW